MPTPSPTPPPTVIPAGATLTGDLHTPGDALIAGRVTGGLRVAGRLTLSATGQIQGPITAAHAALHGHAADAVTVRGQTELFPGTVVNGTLTTGELTARNGARFEGRLVLSPPAAEAPIADHRPAATAPPAPPRIAAPAPTPAPAPAPTPASASATLPFVKVPGAACAGLRLRAPAG